jgi:hypothetical protein
MLTLYGFKSIWNIAVYIMETYLKEVFIYGDVLFGQPNIYSYLTTLGQPFCFHFF